MTDLYNNGASFCITAPDGSQNVINVASGAYEKDTEVGSIISAFPKAEESSTVY